MKIINKDVTKHIFKSKHKNNFYFRETIIYKAMNRYSIINIRDFTGNLIYM
ncbi:MAG: hypothetical protein ACRC5R_01590 [Mycoplasmatales bacterium]